MLLHLVLHYLLMDNYAKVLQYVIMCMMTCILRIQLHVLSKV